MTHGISFGIISPAILVPVIYARYSRHLAGVWRPVDVVGALAAFHLNFVVLIVQWFVKVPILHALAPKQSEPPFLATQVVSMVAFVVLGTLTTRRFHVGQGRLHRPATLRRRPASPDL